MLKIFNYAPENPSAVPLTPTETKVYRTGVHWVVLFWPAVVAILLAIVSVPPLIGAFARNGSIGGTLILVAITTFFLFCAAAVITVAIVRRKSINVVVTNYRLILSAGILRVKVSCTDLDQAIKVSVRQGRLGKQLGYGTVVVREFGGHAVRVENVSRPLLLFEYVRDQLHQRKECNLSANRSKGGSLRRLGP